MQRIIVTDSTSDLDPSFFEKHGIHVIPLSVTIDGKSYVDQIDMSSEEYIKYLAEGNHDLKTSQPALGQFVEKYEELMKDDVEIISIHLTSGLSGTVHTARQASEMVDGKITVIDSKSISWGLAYQIQYLVKWIEEGIPTEEIVKKLEKVQKNIKLFVIIGQLDQLIKGGRISKAKGIMGNLMKIKPIGEVVDGKLEMIHNVRTQGACIKQIISDLKPFVGNDKVEAVGISHADAEGFMHKFKEKLDETFNIGSFQLGHTSPVISTHTGTGAIGLILLKEGTY
ncbi:DegV family protein [Staphylococcus rostri]|uniref:Fatty acid-binding protein DegV n=1 Tax=Staphylococcus rostri TaxID=522262 RepID=A0A2K3YQK9_9STAP|nr:DegV family protein [Staphylococcus rostri]MDO5374801.1 DegV family protein [Staphylococcus rostri]PNZ27893.1 fatty acid-binding protein DegV [Staphylococcus rostri]